MEEHIQHVRLVLRHLPENSLFVKMKNSVFLVSNVAFLGFIIQQVELLPDPTKCPTHTSRKQLEQFLGFANFYHRFIRNYSKVAMQGQVHL